MGYARFVEDMQQIEKRAAWYDNSQTTESALALGSIPAAAYAVYHGMGLGKGFGKMRDLHSNAAWGLAAALQAPGMIGSYLRNRKASKQPKEPSNAA